MKANRDRSQGPVLYVTEKRVFLLDQGSMIEVPGVDAANFWLVEEPQGSFGARYCKDQNVVMYFKAEFENGPRFIVVEGADPKTFQQVKSDYAKDKSNSYFKGKIDAAGALVKIDAVYSKNSKVVFSYEMPVKGADAKSFQVIGNRFSRDQSQVFYDDTPIPGLDPDTFRFLSKKETEQYRDASYVADKLNVYFNTRINTAFQKVEGADVSSFQDLDYSFGADRSHVFFDGKALTGIEREGFAVLHQKDQSGFYLKNKLHVYTVNEDRKLETVKKADPGTFEVMNRYSGSKVKHDAEDSRHFFLNGKVTQKK